MAASNAFLVPFDVGLGELAYPPWMDDAAKVDRRRALDT
jgi:hypothetical protein